MLKAGAAIDMLTLCFEASFCNPDDHSDHRIEVLFNNLPPPPAANQDDNQNWEA